MKNKIPVNFDYIIVGTGVSGFQVAIALQSDVFFKQKKIALIDPNLKEINDKTFCFWEKNSNNWDDIVADSWSFTQFYDKEHAFCKTLDPYIYKRINSIDFYSYCKEKLSKDSRFTFINENVLSLNEDKNTVKVITENQSITGDFVFDSRMPENFSTEKEKYIYTPQTCFGWEIKTENAVFDPEIFVMMDYRFQWKESTTFVYILPKTETEALVEFTVFAHYDFSIKEFENHLKTYLSSFYSEVNYKIISKEDGRIPIPMTNYPFRNNNTNRVIKIGTAGGWVKSTSGYSFKRSEKFVTAIIQQLKTNKHPTGYKQPIRFYYYDKLLLHILKYENTQGARIFSKMFSIPDLSLLFRFLDEETNLWQEINLMLRLPIKPFIKALFSRH